MSRNRPNKFTSELPAHNEPEPLQLGCRAGGCPLRGTRTSSPGGEKRYCHWHYGQDLTHFSEITKRVIDNRGLIERIRALKTLDAYQITQRAPYRYGNGLGEDFAINEGESHGQYITRLEAALKRLIWADIKHPRIEDAKKQVNELAQSTQQNERTWEQNLEAQNRE